MMLHSLNQTGENTANPGGEDANTRRSKAGTSATKNHEKHFGYKAHTLVNEKK